MKLVFCVWYIINRGNKYIQSFQVGVIIFVQSDSKKQVRMNLSMTLIRMNLGMKLIFCM